MSTVPNGGSPAKPWFCGESVSDNAALGEHPDLMVLDRFWWAVHCVVDKIATQPDGHTADRWGLSARAIIRLGA